MASGLFGFQRTIARPPILFRKKVDEKTAPAQTTYQGKTYYFCSTECKDTFTANPGKYAKKAVAEV